MPGRSQVGPHEILLRVDPGRMRLGWPVGLRDGALLALLAAGFTPREVSRLRASAVTMTRGKLLVTVKRESVTWIALAKNGATLAGGSRNESGRPRRE